MNSPFPGMDPYLERSWGDVHCRFITAASGVLNCILPADLAARVEERLMVDPEELKVEEHVETFISILDPSDGCLVTVIEFLSPSNKLPGENRDAYRQKRNELERGKINLVEIDLIRTGSWRDLLRPMVAPRDADTAYRVINRRAFPSRIVELYPISMRNRLPIIPIPLRASDAPAALDLQALLDHVYREGRHDRTRYDESCQPPLDNGDAEWADELLRAAGLKG